MGWAQIFCQGFLRSLWLANLVRCWMHVQVSCMCDGELKGCLFHTAPMWMNFGCRHWLTMRRHVKILVLSLATPGIANSNATAKFCLVFQWSQHSSEWASWGLVPFLAPVSCSCRRATALALQQRCFCPGKTELQGTWGTWAEQDQNESSHRNVQHCELELSMQKMIYFAWITYLSI